jgi:hypothetical protein
MPFGFLHRVNPAVLGLMLLMVPGGFRPGGLLAATFYVDPKGDDHADGSKTRPFASLQKGQDAAQPGDTVYFRGGVYLLSDRLTGVEIWRNGTPDKRIRFWSYEDEIPIFDGAGLRGRGRANAIKVTASWVHFKGLVIRNVPAPRGTSYGIWITGCSNNIFERLTMYGHQGPGLFIDGGTGGHLVLNCDSYNNYDPNSRNGVGQNADGFGCHYQERGPSTIFRGCRAWWNSDDGFDWFKQEVPVIIENCWAMGAGYTPNGAAPASSGNGAGFKMGNTFTGVRHIIRNCVAIKNKAQGFYANHSYGGSEWYNNTAFNNRGSAFDMLSDTTLSGTNVHCLRNNVAYPARLKNLGASDSKNNSWDLGIEVSEEDFLSVSDEGFIGPRRPNGDLPDLPFLKLHAGSRLVDKGVDVALPFTGAAPDLGAYECF